MGAAAPRKRVEGAQRKRWAEHRKAQASADVPFADEPVTKKHPQRKQVGGMDINATLEELIAERGRLDETILALERIAAGRGKRRGRPPLWMRAVQAAQTPEQPKRRRGRPTRTSDQN